MVPLSFSPGLLLALFAGLSTAQNCPFLGPAYLAPTNVEAPAFVAAGAAFEKGLNDALASGKIAGATTSFAVQVYLGSSKKLIYSSYHTPTASNSTRGAPATVGPDTVFRAFSISKLMTVYTILTKLGDKYWDEPLAKYLPEYAHLQVGNPAFDANWEEITLGSLASHMSGIGRDYGLGDYSATSNSTRAPGLRPLLDYETVKCGAETLRPCTRAEALQAILTIFPFSSAFSTPNYSNMAFQLLAYAVENITGTAFPDLVRQQLLEPLHLRNTFLTPPPNTTTNAAITDGWDLDFGGAAPAAGYSLSASDLTALGTSILTSALLSPAHTRKWLKPVAHTSSPLSSLGRPWEIVRTRLPVSNTTRTTRIADIYSKQGGGGNAGGYTSLIALSPDHNLGISLLTAGPASLAAFQALRALTLSTFLPAAEQAARDAALAAFAGTYTLGTNANSTLDLGLHPDEPGLYVRKLVSDGVDVLALAGQLGGYATSGSQKIAAWLYPMGLVGRAFSGTEMAFRASFGAVGVAAREDCASWAAADKLRWGGYPGDLALFGVGGSGSGGVQVSSVRFPILSEVSFRKSGNTGQGIFGPFE